MPRRAPSRVVDRTIPTPPMPSADRVDGRRRLPIADAPPSATPESRGGVLWIERDERNDADGVGRRGRDVALSCPSSAATPATSIIDQTSLPRLVLDVVVKMDTGKSFSKKTLSREPIERIQVTPIDRLSRRLHSLSCRLAEDSGRDAREPEEKRRSDSSRRTVRPRHASRSIAFDVLWRGLVVTIILRVVGFLESCWRCPCLCMATASTSSRRRTQPTPRFYTETHFVAITNPPHSVTEDVKYQSHFNDNSQTPPPHGSHPTEPVLHTNCFRLWATLRSLGGSHTIQMHNRFIDGVPPAPSKNSKR